MPFVRRATTYNSFVFMVIVERPSTRHENNRDGRLFCLQDFP